MNQQIYEEATQWLIRHRDGGIDDSNRHTFDAWLRTSPEHVRAYLEMSSVWEDVSAMDDRSNARAEDLIAIARSDAPVNVIPLGGLQAVEVAPPPAAKPKRYAMAASFAVLAAIAGVLAWIWSSDASTYTTQVGEQRSIQLADGSMVELNSRSRLSVSFSETERTVKLLDGQALFRVAQESKRPFVVRSGGASVRAVGTQFDMYRKKHGTVVTVIEGRVAVDATPESGQDDAAPILLGAGEQLTVAARVPARPARVDVGAATAWTSRHLVFDAASLTEVADEFNRYNTRQLVIDDARLATFNVSGVFSSSDPALLLKFLRSQPEIAVHESERDIRISRQPPQ